MTDNQISFCPTCSICVNYKRLKVCCFKQTKIVVLNVFAHSLYLILHGLSWTKYLYLHPVTSKYPAYNSCLVLSCKAQCIANGICILLAVALCPSPLAQSCHLHTLCRIYISLYRKKYFDLARGCCGTHLYKKKIHFPICLIVKTKH